MRALEALSEIELGPEMSEDDVKADFMAAFLDPQADDHSRTDHRTHLRALASWLRRRLNKCEELSRFSDDAVAARNALPQVRCRCISDDIVRCMAEELAEDPVLDDSDLVDQTFAKRHNTSASMLQKVRAELGASSQHRKRSRRR